jgi:hypothetical protein
LRKVTLLAVAALSGCGGSDGRIAVSHEANISQAPGPQVEAAIAVDPSDPDVLLAGCGRRGRQPARPLHV